MSLSLACLDAPATYEAKTQIPPFIIADEVTPALNALVTLSSDAPLPIDVPFRSEDLGEDVIGRVYLDVVSAAPRQLGRSIRLPGSTFDDDTRRVAKSVDLGQLTELGCHTLTLRLTQENHASDQASDESSVASVVWWLNIEDASAGTVGAGTLANCPSEGRLE